MRILKDQQGAEMSAKCTISASKFLIKATLKTSGSAVAASELIEKLNESKAQIVIKDSSSQDSVISSSCPLGYLAHYDSFGEGVISATTATDSEAVQAFNFTIALTPDGAAFALDNDEYISLVLKMAAEFVDYQFTVFAIESPLKTSNFLKYTSLSMSQAESKTFNLENVSEVLLPADVTTIEKYSFIHSNAEATNISFSEVEHLQHLNNDFTLLLDNAVIEDSYKACLLYGVSTAKALTLYADQATTYLFYAVSSHNRSKMVDRVNAVNASLTPTTISK